MIGTNTAPITKGESGTVYTVSPDGNPMSLTEAMGLAGPGDIISLVDGLYREPIVTMNAVSMVYTGAFGVHIKTDTDSRLNDRHGFVAASYNPGSTCPPNIG